MTAVDVSPDLRQAKVYFSCLGDEDERNRILAGLKSATGFLRAQVTRRLQLRHTPQLHFLFDAGLEATAHMTQLLRDVDKSSSESE